ncbi:ABC transporter ATP-binding protein [Lacrimispora indolis]|uniref:ABC transporter ATP-binding protein n=1 Tax=Lacrimispora indolis TaxID=69825 RepID=UPI0004121FD9|nr:ABC transporter ATP-binding protein [[Clostridium] methoxybenzovorans]
MTEKKPSSSPIGGRGGLQGKPENAKDFKGTMLHLARYLEPYKRSVFVVVLFAGCSSVFSIAGPKILGKATTKLFEGLIAWMMGTGLLTDFRYIRNRLLLLVVLYLVSAVFSYLQSYIMSGISMKVTYELRKNISEKMNRLPLNYYDTRTHGEILSRITNDVDTVSQTLNQSLTQIITSVTTLVGIVIMMISISIRMTLVAVLVLMVSMVLIMFVVKKSQVYFQKQQESLGYLNGHIEEIYSGHNVVQIFNGEKEAIEKFRTINYKLYGSAWKSQFLSGMMMPIMSFISNLGYVFVCLLGGYLTVEKVIEIGDVQAFIQYMRSFMQPISQIANVSNTLQSTAAAAERVFEFLDEQDEVPESEAPIKLQSIHGNVEFKNVCFGYTPDTLIIHDFSSAIKAGQMVAIVGPTGAGKTTVVKLLMRFYELNSGHILIDGHDTLDFTRGDLRSMFGMVLQETWLYNATIMDNIRYGNFDKTDEEVIEAAKAAHCDEFIRALPGGYYMMINEESSNLSQGQKQLLTIARTILADPRVLILDEATSSIDTRTEVLIQKAMGKLMQGRTSFVIAHRLSTIRDADLILVMKDGDIIEQGNHVSLLEKKGFYADLYHSQFAD